MNIKILAEGLKFPEGPVVDSKGDIYLVELRGESITKVSREDGSFERFHVGGMPNGMAEFSENKLVFCDAGNNAIRVFDKNTGATETLTDGVDGKPLNQPNDLIFDSEGNILFTCPGGSVEEPVGYMCCYGNDGKTSVIADGMRFPNGLMLYGDNDIIINESHGHRLLKGKWNPDVKLIENIEEFYPIGGTAEPDGLTLAENRLIYAAVYGTGMVWVFSPDGSLKKQLELPGKCPTNLCFDTCGSLGLLVTEAQHGKLLSITEL